VKEPTSTMAYQNYYDILPRENNEEEEIKNESIIDKKVLERLQALETIIKQQQHQIEVLKKKNNMLEKIVECMKNDKKRKEETKEFKLKIEEDFVKEVVEFKYTNVLLIDQLEIVYKENEILKEMLK
jgi:hypothetical protein